MPSEDWRPHLPSDIWFYLSHSYLAKEDIATLSLVCRIVRETVLPIIFFIGPLQNLTRLWQNLGASSVYLVSFRMHIPIWATFFSRFFFSLIQTIQLLVIAFSFPPSQITLVSGIAPTRIVYPSFQSMKYLKLGPEDWPAIPGLINKAADLIRQVISSCKDLQSLDLSLPDSFVSLSIIDPGMIPTSKELTRAPMVAVNVLPCWPVHALRLQITKFTWDKQAKNARYRVTTNQITRHQYCKWCWDFELHTMARPFPKRTGTCPWGLGRVEG